MGVSGQTQFLKTSLGWFSDRVAEMRNGTTVNDYNRLLKPGLNSLRNSVIQSPLAVSRVFIDLWKY
jgi:hypothetical protein